MRDAAPSTKEKMFAVRCPLPFQHGVKLILTLKLSELIYNNFISYELSKYRIVVAVFFRKPDDSSRTLDSYTSNMRINFMFNGTMNSVVIMVN